MKLSRRDKTVTILLIIVILILIYVMQCHCRNRFGARGDAKPVGEVEYKYHQVQRKLSDRMVWEEVDSKSPIYAYDWVMTKDKSDARITLNNGMKVDMDPESMVEIDETKSGVGLTLRDGSIRADTRNSKTGTITGADGTKIDLDNANAQITSDGKNLSVDVKQGNATVKNNDKESKIAAGETGNVNASGVTREKTGILIKSPETGFVFEDAAAPVVFAYDAPQGTEDCKIEISGNKTKRTIKASAGGAREKFADGTYSWRVRCKLKGESISSQAGVFRVRPQASFALLAPASGEVITADRAESLVLKWRGATAVRVELSQNSGFSSLAQSANVNGTSLAAKNLKPGKYFWRVYPQGKKGSALSSSFTVSEKGELLTQTDAGSNKPVNTKPAKETPPKKTEPPKNEKARLTAKSQGKVVIEPDAATGAARISWTPVNAKYKYRVRISADSDFSQGVVTREVSGKGQVTLPLKPGEYFYRVDVRKTTSGRPLAATQPQKLVVTRKKLPPPPRVKSVQAD